PVASSGVRSATQIYTLSLHDALPISALIHLHLACGQIGKPGAGPFSLTGQPNAMGGREAGGMATLLPGHRSPDNADDRAEVAKLDRKSTRLNSSHVKISYAVFCLKKK